MSRPITRFVVFFLGRSGSSHFVSVLNSHPDIHATGECLVGLRKLEKQIEKARLVLTTNSETRLKALGLKTKFGDLLDFETFKSLMHELDCRVIYLTRQNWVKWAISVQNAVRLNESQGKWNLDSNDQDLGPIEIDPDRFHKALENAPKFLRASDEKIENIGLPTLHLHYEQLLVEPQSTIENVYSFLGVRTADFHSGVKKNTSDDLRKAVKNFDELKERYIGTIYEPMFDEVLMS